MHRPSREWGGLALQLSAPASPWGRRTLDVIAIGVASGTAGEGVIVEQSSSDPSPRVLSPFPGVLAYLYRRSAQTSGAVDVVRIRSAPQPMEAVRSAWGAIRPRGDSSPKDETREFPVRLDGDRRATHDPLGSASPFSYSAGWWAVQHHWVASGDGGVLVHVRFRLGLRDVLAATQRGAWERSITGHLTQARFPPLEVAWVHDSHRSRSEWDTGSLRATPRRLSFALDPSTASRAVILVSREEASLAEGSEPHTAVFGSSGTGKTTYLAKVGAEWVRDGRSVVGFDLHGDLAPRIAALVSPAARERILAIDASAPVHRILGTPVLGVASADHRDREAAMVVAAMRRLSSEGETVYWGFRLERIFDAFVRLVQESGGGLNEVYGLLTDPRLREAARLSTHSRVLATFLEELPPLLQRNPEFLWPAAARLSKVALIPAVAALLSPPEAGLDVRGVLRSGGSILWRLSMSVLGPEAASFAASLLAGRVYLDCVGAGTPGDAEPRVLFLLDEAQAFSPRLVTEILAEGRKFGVRAFLATQYVERLTPELRLAAQGTVGRHLIFRVPPSATRGAAAWLGLPLTEPVTGLLATLPTGTALTASRAGVALFEVPPRTSAGTFDEAAWAGAVRRTTERYLGPELDAGEPHHQSPEDRTEDGLLLAAFGATAAGVPASLDYLRELVRRDPDPRVDSDGIPVAAARLVRRGWLAEEGGAYLPTPAGLSALGYSARTGATNESEEHRRLLLETFRVFASHSCHLRILRQGRFDRRIPDAFFAQLPDGIAGADPTRIADAVDRARTRWAWRFFGGRNVHVEAEVSGATRPERLRRGLAKARAEGAFTLFVVGDARSARAVKRVVTASGRWPHEAQVWTLRPRAPRSPPAVGSSG